MQGAIFYSRSFDGEIVQLTERERLSDALNSGGFEAGLAIQNGKLVNVHSGEIYEADIATLGSRIGIISSNIKEYIGKQTQIVDARGKFLVPGLIDAHYHVAGTYLTMTNLAKALLARGTTAIASDFYEYGAVGGVEAIKFALAESNQTPLKVLFNVPSLSYLQNNPFGNTNKVESSDLMEMLNWDSAVALGEVQPQTSNDPAIREIVAKTIRLKKIVVGHYVGFDEKGLASFMALGPSSDHESTTAKEAVEKIRRGIHILIREGSAATDLANVVRAITEYGLDPRRFMFCTDEVDALDLMTLGHMDYKIRKAVGMGLLPISAIQMATINAAEYFRVEHDIGSLAPGKVADIVLVKDVSDFRADLVIANGRIVAKEGAFLGRLTSPEYPQSMVNSVKLASNVTPERVHVKIRKSMSREASVNIIVALEGLLISDKKVSTLQVKDEVVLPDPQNDILKITVAERHGADKIGSGFINGFNLKSGVIAESFAPIPENIVAVGATDEDVAYAINRIKEMQGGLVVAEKGKVLSEMRLPILGLMSEKPLDQVAIEMSAVMASIRSLGCRFKSPFLTLMFMAYPLIPTLKITESGLVDVDKMRYIDVIADES